MKQRPKTSIKNLISKRKLRNWITILLVIDGLLLLLQSLAPKILPWGVALNSIFALTVVLIVIDLALKIINHRKKPWQFLRNPWNILDIVTLLIVIGLPAYRSLIFVRFGRVFSGLIGVGSRSILKRAFLAKSAVQKTVMQAQAEAQSRYWDLA